MKISSDFLCFKIMKMVSSVRFVDRSVFSTNPGEECPYSRGSSKEAKVACSRSLRDANFLGRVWEWE